ncbi:jg11245 [Pararge aegeria aegeria]|uniref:Jg11245 protein n=1 Tax=Pararge aegeria aegeria TaxID=348720 RepID=A0A8S4RKA6_9NEOP|nr:jg11245 [Pararge aegeria aegeria]
MLRYQIKNEEIRRRTRFTDIARREDVMAKRGAHSSGNYWTLGSQGAGSAPSHRYTQSWLPQIRRTDDIELVAGNRCSHALQDRSMWNSLQKIRVRTAIG